MPPKVKLHIIDSFSRNSVSNNTSRLFEYCLALIQGRNNIIKIMSIYFNHMPVECLVLHSKWLKRHDILTCPLAEDMVITLYAVADLYGRRFAGVK